MNRFGSNTDRSNMNRFGLSILICAALAAGVFTGCSATGSTSVAAADSSPSAEVVESNASAAAEPGALAETESAGASTAAESGASAEAGGPSASAAAEASPSSNGASEASSQSSGSWTSASAGLNSSSVTAIDVSDLFTDRDLEQEADTSEAKSISVSDGQDLSITEEGTYVISGTAKDCTITVEADDSAKVQIVLDGVNISNDDAPAIYVLSADKVFVTTASGSTNSLSTTGAFANTADSNVDGVIFSKDDLVLNGQGTLSIESSANGIVGKDDVKVTGGTYVITASAGHGIQGKDSVLIADGDFTITASKDAIHGKNSDDPTLGYVYIADGTFKLKAGSDGIQGTSVAQIDGGTFTIDAAEGIEGTTVQVNDGTIGITASDDGINATAKSSAYDVKIEINGGAINIDMGAGDTDALDVNGDLIINGGTVDITAQYAFDFDGRGELNGGTVTVNGQQVTSIENSMMGGMGGRGGQGRPGDASGQGWQKGQSAPDGADSQDGGQGPDGQEQQDGQGGPGHMGGHGGPGHMGGREGQAPSGALSEQTIDA